jgi:hypothetical protein
MAVGRPRLRRRAFGGMADPSEPLKELPHQGPAHR